MLCGIIATRFCHQICTYPWHHKGYGSSFHGRRPNMMETACVFTRTDLVFRCLQTSPIIRDQPLTSLILLLLPNTDPAKDWARILL